ncbi:DUF975 family protein [Thermospira aquatica]|uniref:CDP-alcohol phosphatidyltransferase family protein n=1 Tax=Thermospira aquatica TaxID=2828656 RepID=A0AAX3BFM6_9SPIR|nr:hypothetical protein [Thermospira aquatica]URA10938.1 hypothetical protein KDW03_03805 [Thermospira aquatica]
MGIVVAALSALCWKKISLQLCDREKPSLKDTFSAFSFFPAYVTASVFGFVMAIWPYIAGLLLAFFLVAPGGGAIFDAIQYEGETIRKFFLNDFPEEVITGLEVFTGGSLILFGFMIVIGTFIYGSGYFVVKLLAFTFFAHMIVDEKVGPYKALKRSEEITKGVKGKLFWFRVMASFITLGEILLLGTLIYFCMNSSSDVFRFLMGGGMLLVGAAFFITHPLLKVAGAFLYRALNKRKRKKRIRYWYG